MLRLGTRKSPLALIQGQMVASELQKIYPKTPIHLVPYSTSGDRTTQSLKDIGGKALFTKELQEALLKGEIDGAVHSLKDVECHSLPLVFGAMLKRENPSDVLITHQDISLDLSKPESAIVFGSCSPRRLSQMKQSYPKIIPVDLRGNVGTRLKYVQHRQIDATILAKAGLLRLGYSESQDLQKDFPNLQMTPLPLDRFIPSAGQGVIAVECLLEKAHLFSPINHQKTALLSKIERMFTVYFSGNCRTAIGAYAYFDSAKKLFMLDVFYEGTYAQKVLGTLNDLKNTQYIENQIQKLILKTSSKKTA